MKASFVLFQLLLLVGFFDRRCEWGGYALRLSLSGGKRGNRLFSLGAIVVPEQAVQRYSSSSLSNALKMRVSLARQVRNWQLEANSSSHSSGVSQMLHQLRHLMKESVKMPSTRLSRAVKSIKAAELRDKGIHPVLVFVNKRSGGGIGRKILTPLRKVLHDVQVCDVHSQSPAEVLSKFAGCSDILRVVICGGDGTVSRIVHDMLTLNMSHVPIGLVPIGTGNDLANTLSLSTSDAFRHVTINDISSDPIKALWRFIHPNAYDIDIWKIQRAPFGPKLMSKYMNWIPKIDRPKNKTIVNYFSIGLDSHVSLDFDALRHMRPYLFVSSIINKLWYGLLGFKLLLQQPDLDLSSTTSIECDGRPVVVPKGTKCLVFLNIDSYAAGTQLWEESYANDNDQKWKPSSPTDGMLEVI